MTVDLVASLLQDHEEVRQLFRKIAASTGDEREHAFGTLRAELVRHEVAEEEIVRPLTKRYIADGEQIAGARIEEESQAEKLLAELEKVDVGTAEWQALFANLESAVLEHAANEEAVEFPALQGAVDEEELQSRAKTFETAKKMAPTHPHPGTPNTPGANFALGPVAALIDRARDAVSRASS